MGIYREGYRHYTGSLLSPSSRYLVVYIHELQRMLAGRWTRRLLYLAILPLAVTVITLMARMAESAVDFDAGAISREVFRGLLIAELNIAALLAAVAGAGSVAEDRHAKALVLYLCRPLSSFRYLLAKGMAVATLLMAVMVVPAVLYVLSDVLVAKSIDLNEFGVSLFTALIPTTLIAVLFTATTVWLSTFASKTAYVSMGWLALFYGSGMIMGLISLADDSLETVKLFSLPELCQQLVGWALQHSTQPGPWIASAIWLMLMAAGWYTRQRVLRAQAVSA